MTPSSPRLDALLVRLRQTLVRLAVLHGVGTALAATGAWLCFAFYADRWLHLPAPIRLFHSLLLLGLPVFILRRDLFGPLRRMPGPVGLAMLLERVHRGTQDLLVSALQLGPRAAESPARELIERVVEQAEARSAELSIDPVVDARGPRRRLAAGAALGLVAALVLASQPALAGIFFRRMLGADVRWPQRTHLLVEVPAVGDRIQVEAGPETIHVRAARGSDVPVHVRAEGVVPREVLLHFDSGHESALASGGTPLFKTLLRSVQEDLSFHVTGGDDRSGLPVVRIEVLQPPDVAGVAWDVVPPAYSGLPARLVHAPDVEVLQGSRVRVHLRPDPASAHGVARLLPEGRELPLVPHPYPSPEGAGETPGLSFEIDAELSLRIAFELVDETGLPNPDPGLFALSVVEDRRPEVQLLAPGRADLDVVAGGAVPLRVRVEDDFGLAALSWDVRSVNAPDEPLSQGTLTSRPLERVEELFGADGLARVATERLEVDALGGTEALAEGQQVTLQVFARDNRQPEANESPSAPVRLRLVSGDEYLRRLQDNLARAKEQADRLMELAEEKESLTRELLASAVDDEPESFEGGVGDLGSLVHGARRVQGDARALGRQLAGLTEGLLYSRIDARAGPLLEDLDRALADTVDRSFHPAPWLAVSGRYRAGELGPAEVAGDLLEMTGMALEISEEHALVAADALLEAQEATDAVTARGSLERASAAQARARDTLDLLLVKLGEWDNFQSVLTLTRDILQRQKNLNQRTRKQAEDR